MTKKNESTKNEQVEKEIADNKPVTPSVQMVPEVPEKETPTETKEEVKPKSKSSSKKKKETPIEERSLETLVEEVNRGQHGSGRERMITLGTRYTEVQTEITRQMRKGSK